MNKSQWGRSYLLTLLQIFALLGAGKEDQNPEVGRTGLRLDGLLRDRFWQ